MGRDKAWLRIGGEHLLHRVARISLEASPRVVVVASPGQALPALPGGAERVDDPPERAHRGPLSGLLTGFEALAPSRVELVYLGSGDAVFVTAAHIHHLLDLLRDDRGSPAVVPQTLPPEGGKRTLHGLSGAVRLPLAREKAAALIGSGERSVRTLYECLGTRRLDVTSLPDPRVVRGCNTPEQWAEALAELAPDRGT